MMRKTLLCVGTIAVFPCSGFEDAGSLLQLKLKNTVGSKESDETAAKSASVMMEQGSSIDDAEFQEEMDSFALANDPETKWLDDADQAYEDMMLKDDNSLEMLEVSEHAGHEKPESVFFNQVDESLFTETEGTMGLVKYHAASNSIMVTPSRAMFNMSIDEHIETDRQSFDSLVGNLWNGATVYLKAGEFSVSMRSYGGTVIDINNKWDVKIIGATSYGVPTTNVNIYHFDCNSRSQGKNYIFKVFRGGRVTIKNIRIRHAQGHLHHSVAAVTSVSGHYMWLTIENGFNNLGSSFYGEHFMQLMSWRFDSHKSSFTQDGMGQLGYKVGKWEHFNEDNKVSVKHEGGSKYKLWFPRSLPGDLRNHKMLIMHQKRAVVGVMADNVQGLTVSHLKFGSFGGAALNFKRVKDPTLYGMKCQPIHNEARVKRIAWATCNDLGWLRNPYGRINARKTTCMQQTDDCLNFHVFTPQVREAATWFWNEWCQWGETLMLYKPNGEFNKEVKYYGKSSLPSDNYVLIKRLSPGGSSPVLGNKWSAGTQILEYRALNTRSRLMIKVNNVLLRNVVVKYDFMSGINDEAEQCSKWREGIPCSDVLMENIQMQDINSANKYQWRGALMIGSKCNGNVVQHTHKNIKLVNYRYDRCTSFPPYCNNGEADKIVEGVTNFQGR